MSPASNWDRIPTASMAFTTAGPPPAWPSCRRPTRNDGPAARPPGRKLGLPIDNTTFIRLSIHDVVVTLIEAIALVVLVMYVFLQNWRATLIPAIAVPVVLLGTFGVLAAAHYSINTLTLFA